MDVNIVSGCEEWFWRGIGLRSVGALLSWAPELAVLHTEQLQPNRARHCSPTGLEQRQGWPAGTWSSTHAAHTICKLTWKVFQLTHFTFATSQQHWRSQLGSPANVQECSTWHKAPMLLNPRCDGIWGCSSLSALSLQVQYWGEAESRSVHPTVVMYVAITLLPAFLDVPHEEM